MAQRGEWTDGRKYIQTENLPILQDFVPYWGRCRAFSHENQEPVTQRHQMVSSSLALLYFLLGFHGGRQGSGPNRGQSPVEWGDFPYLHPPICLFPPLGQPAKPEAQPARPEAQKVPKKCLVWVFKVTCHHINRLKIKERKGVIWGYVWLF